MARPSPERLELATYPVVRRMEPRFGDMDALRHLNNVALGRFYEDTRVRFMGDIGARGAFEPRHGMLIAEVAIQYLNEGHFPDELTVGLGVIHIGRSSFALAQGLFQHGRCIGTADTTLVYVDRSGGGSRPLPEAVRTILQGYGLTPSSVSLSKPETTEETPHA